MDVDPLSDALVWRVESSSSSRAKVDKRVKRRRASTFEAVNKMYKGAKMHFVALIEKRRTAGSMEKH